MGRRASQGVEAAEEKLRSFIIASYESATPATPARDNTSLFLHFRMRQLSFNTRAHGSGMGRHSFHRSSRTKDRVLKIGCGSTRNNQPLITEPDSRDNQTKFQLAKRYKIWGNCPPLFGYNRRCGRLGLHLLRGKTTHNHYGRSCSKPTIPAPTAFPRSSKEVSFIQSPSAAGGLATERDPMT